jgi:hypothetical protein
MVIEWFSRPQRLRRLAGRMLLVWVFVLTTTVANACVPGHGRHDTMLAATDHQQADPPTLRHEHAGTAVGHGHQFPPAADTPCAKFCADVSAGTPPVAQQIHHLSAVWWAPPPMALVAFDAMLEPVGAFDTEHGQLYERVPISLVFMRLTL